MTQNIEQLQNKSYDLENSELSNLLLKSSNIITIFFDSYIEMNKESSEYAKSLPFGDELFRLNLKLAFQSGWMAAMNYMEKTNKE